MVALLSVRKGGRLYRLFPLCPFTLFLFGLLEATAGGEDASALDCEVHNVRIRIRDQDRGRTE